MKKFVFIILTLGLVAYLLGCGKKQQAEEFPEALTMEVLSTVGTEPKPAAIAPAVSQTKPAATAPAQLAPLPPAGPYKPSNQEIQTALKNAGLYTGNVDGKVGPMTKKAIEEFQRANGLEADGKVGPKTWAVLSKHLNTEGVEKR